MLVIVNRFELVEEFALWSLAEDRISRRIPKTPLGLIVHTLGEVNQWLHDGHYFFRDIREQGIELYCAGQDERFARLFPADNQFCRRSFHRLKRAYVEGLYGHTLHLNINDVYGQTD